MYKTQKLTTASPRSQGFTLIEVLIAVAIVGILAGIAVPLYTQYIVDARRTDAMAFLSEVAGEQVRYFSSNNEYADSMAELGYAADGVSPEGHYSVTVSNPDGGSSFLLTAEPVATGRQANDSECTAFTISHTGAKGSSGTGVDCWR